MQWIVDVAVLCCSVSDCKKEVVKQVKLTVLDLRISTLIHLHSLCKYRLQSAAEIQKLSYKLHVCFKWCFQLLYHPKPEANMWETRNVQSLQCYSCLLFCITSFQTIIYHRRRHRIFLLLYKSMANATERANFDPQRLRHHLTDFDETQTLCPVYTIQPVVKPL